MTKYVLTCCSTTDMSLEYFKKRDIPFISFHYILDGKEYPDDLGQTISFKEFYSRVAAGSMPTTSQVNANKYMEFFEPFLEEGKDILHISFSSALSGSHNSSHIAKADLKERYPDREIKIVDSLAASSGYGLLTDMAVDMRDEGKTLDEIYNWLEDNKLSVHHWFFSSDLSHYKRGGRISATSATIGGLLNICPLMNVSHEGKLVPRKKIRGKKQVIKESVKMMEMHAKNGTDYSGKCFISHSDCYDDARAVADLVEERFSNLEGSVIINSIGTVIGSHTGPGTVALFFVGDKRID